MGTVAWVVIGVVVFVGVAAHRGRRKEAGLPVPPGSGNSALGLYCLVLGLDYVGRTDEVWPYVVLLGAPWFIGLEIVGSRRPQWVAQPTPSSLLRAVTRAFNTFGWLCVAVTVAGFVSKGSVKIRCEPGAVSCDEELLWLIGFFGVVVLLIGSVLAVVARSRSSCGPSGQDAASPRPP